MYKKYTLIIPVAGLGTRLNSSEPKNLFNVSGRPILNWIIDQVPEEVEELILVTSKSHLLTYQDEITKQYLKKIGSISIKVQPKPEGTLSAIRIGLNASSNDLNLIIWGDQIGVTKTFLKSVIVNADDASTIVLPLIYKNNPYVYFTLDNAGKILTFIETKNTSLNIFGGLTDSGTFLISRSKMQKAFEDLHEQEKFEIETKGECNFLSTFKALESMGFLIKKLIHYDLNSTHAINSLSDVENFVSNRQ
jgi:bifunctional N-acetylglucosamine-1-phosphate-uridyltransferase/glucosamine-1-phosphate-acetyltransferase GlmU-like protein